MCQLFKFVTGAGLTGAQERTALDPEDHIFEHRETLHEHEVLVDHADARGDRILRRTDVDAPAADQDFAGIGTVEPVDDVHQRRLARAIFADEAVDAAAGGRERHSPVRVHGAKPFVDAAQFERGRGWVYFFNHEWARIDPKQKTPTSSAGDESP